MPERNGLSPTPVLQVVSKTMALEGSTGGNGHTNMIHFTNLRVCDGSGDVMLARLSMQIAHDGDKLKEGDIIQLNLFTPLTYAPQEEGEAITDNMLSCSAINELPYQLIHSRWWFIFSHLFRRS